MCIEPQTDDLIENNSTQPCTDYSNNINVILNDMSYFVLSFRSAVNWLMLFETWKVIVNGHGRSVSTPI